MNGFAPVMIGTVSRALPVMSAVSAGDHDLRADQAVAAAAGLFWLLLAPLAAFGARPSLHHPVLASKQSGCVTFSCAAASRLLPVHLSRTGAVLQAA